MQVPPPDHSKTEYPPPLAREGREEVFAEC